MRAVVCVRHFKRQGTVLVFIQIDKFRFINAYRCTSISQSARYSHIEQMYGLFEGLHQET